MKTLADLCKPRASVFDKARLDTVYNLDDLPTIHPDEFLSENYVTEGMRILLTEAFNRLEGKTTSASGTFLLSQSMGAGRRTILSPWGSWRNTRNTASRSWPISSSRVTWARSRSSPSAAGRPALQTTQPR